MAALDGRAQSAAQQRAQVGTGVAEQQVLGAVLKTYNVNRATLTSTAR